MRGKYTEGNGYLVNQTGGIFICFGLDILVKLDVVPSVRKETIPPEAF